MSFSLRSDHSVDVVVPLFVSSSYVVFQMNINFELEGSLSYSLCPYWYAYSRVSQSGSMWSSQDIRH